MEVLLSNSIVSCYGRNYRFAFPNAGVKHFSIASIVSLNEVYLMNELGVLKVAVAYPSKRIHFVKLRI